MKAKITITFEYEINPEYYPKEFSLHQMLDYDLDYYKDDPCEALANNDFTVVGELLDES